jgi:hypothetical protein
MIIDVERCELQQLLVQDEHVDNDWPGYSVPAATRHRWIT